MPSRAADLRLQPDEFAVLFRSDAGVDANELGIFLQRASTVGRRAGAELQVVAVEHGSVAVILRTIKRSSIAKSAGKEFAKAPIGTTAAGTAIVGAVVSAIVFAMAATHGEVTPLAKAGADLVENHQVQEIQIVTINQTFVVMDEHRVEQLRAVERRVELPREALPAPEVRQLIAQGRKGTLSGEVFYVAGELHFRPDGYRYLVPVDTRRSEAIGDLKVDVHFRVVADILTHNGQPDTIIIHDATPL